MRKINQIAIKTIKWRKLQNVANTTTYEPEINHDSNYFCFSFGFIVNVIGFIFISIEYFEIIVYCVILEANTLLV